MIPKVCCSGKVVDPITELSSLLSKVSLTASQKAQKAAVTVLDEIHGQIVRQFEERVFLQTHPAPDLIGFNFTVHPKFLSQNISEVLAYNRLPQFLHVMRKEIASAKGVQTLELINSVDVKAVITKEQIALLAKAFPHVRCISFKRHERGEVESPIFPPFRLDFEALEALKLFPNLDELSFSGYFYEDDLLDPRFVQAIAQLPHLQSLGMSRTIIHDLFLKGLLFAPHLRCLNISNCQNISEKGLKAFAANCRMKAIVCKGCVLSSDLFNAVNRVKQGVKLFGDSLEGDSVEVSKILLACDFDFTHPGHKMLVKHLRDIRETIRTLDFKASDIGCKSLKIDSKKLLTAAELFPYAETIFFSDAHFERHAFPAFASFKRLRSLTFERPKGFTDHSTRQLAHCKGLRSLRIFESSEMTSAGYADLFGKCRHLRHFEVAECPQVSQQIVTALRVLAKQHKRNIVLFDGNFQIQITDPKNAIKQLVIKDEEKKR